MFSELVRFALCALSVVKVHPSAGCQDALQVMPQDDLSMTAQCLLEPFKIVNLGVGGSAFVLDENVLTHIGDTDHGNDGLWVGYAKGDDRYTIKNVGKDAWVSVGDNGRLVVGPEAKAVEFAVESAGPNTWVIKKPFEDLLWEAVYDGTSMKFGYVTLRESPGSRPGYQHWTFAR
ncbi:hypothetical protein MVEN_00922000 [Mycena venus]|uniref:Lectin n=1 Tax=Mycena venus TaxID=2733690 RepID=A0A8H7CZ47_9AGAR|nr:hypothetical protein MVEN_00922000 [Mycena venus]